jgi:predicted unusual protein kinase regulating ubiquinone biosynthesis (AarF/ABC1/UbiB family)
VPAFSNDLQDLMRRVRGSAIKDIPFGVVLQDMLDIALRHDVPVPASLALTVKALAQMQSAAALLDPQVDPFEVAGRFITHAAMRRIAANADPKMLLLEAQKFKLRAGRLMDAVERVVGARPGDKLEVNFRGTSLEDTIRRVGHQIALGMVGGLALVASAITANARGITSASSIAFGAAGIAAVAVLTLGVARGLTRGRKQ